MDLNHSQASLTPSAENRFNCNGEWNLAGIVHLDERLAKIHWPRDKSIVIDGSKLSAMDSSGAWKLYQLLSKLSQQGFKLSFEGFRKEHQSLLEMIESQAQQFKILPRPHPRPWLDRLGKKTVAGIEEAVEYFTFTGELTVLALRMLRHPQRIPLIPFLRAIEVTGYQALPIIALLSFLIGVVLAYQMGLQLKNYGANMFVVDLVGFSTLREFGPLLTAIIVIARTGSSFTAQIGIMKINEEVDALRTMGLHPGEILILPRILGLLVALPLLTIWADIFGVFGGMVMANSMFQITYGDFLTRFQHQINLSSLMIGLGKAPVFALLIASKACFQGMKVSGSAESVGQKTTKSVVEATFILIVADAAFSIIFKKFGL